MPRALLPELIVGLLQTFPLTGLFFAGGRYLLHQEKALAPSGQGSLAPLHYSPTRVCPPRIEFGNYSRFRGESFPISMSCFSVFDRAHPRRVT
jgi:hypothetical protein